MCRVRIRVVMNRCYRCLEFGHKGDICKGEDRRDLCVKCGKAGYKARECVNAPYCVVCKSENHRADSMGCPRFREIVRRENDKMKVK